MPAYQMAWIHAGSGASRVAQTLAVTTDGAVWYWARAGGDSTIGTFQLPASAERAAQVAGSVAALTALAPQDEDLRPGGVSLALEVNGERRHRLDASRGSHGRPPAVVHALALETTLRDEVLARPLAAFRFALRLAAGRRNRAGDVVFELTSIGSQAVKFRFDERFSLYGHRPDGQTFTWRGLTGEGLGWDDARGEPLDGVLGPASLAPGQVATMRYPAALEAGPGRYSVVGAASGEVELVRPDQQSPGWLGEAFSVTSRPQDWTMR